MDAEPPERRIAEAEAAAVRDAPPVKPDVQESLTTLAVPENAAERLLALIPRILASKAHVVFLLFLGIFLILLPVLGLLHPTAGEELIGGNYANVTSDIGACIAAGGTMHLVRVNRRRSKVEAERLRLAQETHRLLHYVHDRAARELGHTVPETYADMRPEPKPRTGRRPNPLDE